MQCVPPSRKTYPCQKQSKIERPNERQKQKQQFKYNLTTCLSSERFAAKHLLNYSSDIRAICLPLLFPINFKLFSFQCQAPDGIAVLKEYSGCNNNTSKPVTRIKQQNKQL
jgi:hypothetical protein